jgi:putative transposase
MRSRGLGDPILVVSDGAPGVIKAIETCFPCSARQRCLAHQMRNIAAKVPEDQWPEIKARIQACYQAPSRAIARDLAKGVVADYGRELPSAVACFEDDFEACIADLRMPVTHRRAIMTTNLLERLFVEERRPLEDHPQRLRRAAGAEADVRGDDPRRRPLARHQVHRLERRQIAAVRQDLDQEYQAETGDPTPSSGRQRLCDARCFDFSRSILWESEL